MAAQPLGYDVIFDENGTPKFSEDAAARLRERLGHDPTPGETLRLVDPLDDADDVLPDITERSLDQFLRAVAVKTFDDMDAHPKRNLTTEQVQENLNARHAARIAAE